MKNEVRIFFTALMYFTRIRVPKSIGHDPAYLKKAPKYFPLIGWIVGAGSSLAFLIFSKYFSPETGMLASMIAGLLLTGGFHEDGFADTCDGFGGGWTKEKILLIMKDSRIGAFGTMGLIMIFAAKFLLLRELFASLFLHENDYDRYFILCILTAHSLSRLMPVLVMQWSKNVTDADHSKSRPVTGGKLTLSGLILPTVFACLPFAFLPWHFLLIIPPVLFAAYTLNGYFTKWIGGYTGDCLGAVQQVCEIVFYLGSILICKYLWTST